jgi:4-amino-4-deoxy-L-arabinose transferase-like glycosyltransferase
VTGRAVWPWLVVGGLTVALHAAVLARTWPHPDRFVSSTDSFEYLSIADNLLAGHGFSQSSSAPYVADLRRTPLFPVMLASIFAVSGRDLPPAAAVNAGVGLLATLMISMLVARKAGARAGVATAAFLAVDLTTLAYRHLLLTESVFTTLLVAAVWALAAPLTLRPRHALLAGLALGLAGLCRPIGLFLSPGLLLVFLFRARAQGWKQAMGQYAILNAVCALVLGLWVARNAVYFGVFALTSLGGVNLYFHRAAYVEATLEGSDVSAVRDRLERDFEERSRGWTERDKLAWLSEHGRAGITAHPITYIGETLGGLARMFSPERDEVYRLLDLEPFSRGGRLLWGLTWLHLAVLYVCAAIGLVRALRFPPAHQLIVVTTVILAYLIVLSGPEMYARFRMPLMPLLAALGGMAFRRAPGRIS